MLPYARLGERPPNRQSYGSVCRETWCGNSPYGSAKAASLWIYVGPRDAKEHLTISCRDSPSLGRWVSSPWNADGSDSGIVRRSLEACDPLSPGQSLLHVKPARRQCVGAVTTPAARLAVSRETARAEALQVVSCESLLRLPMPCCRLCGSISPEVDGPLTCWNRVTPNLSCGLCSLGPVRCTWNGCVDYPAA